ncbi:MAG: M1 family metallopeptidase [Bacteroidetes bacterium]|nr:M1 family metallopeptidase [Bacteroidota bacterium]
MKNKSKLLTFILIAFAISTFGQFPQNTYQSASNKYYWKNRKPYEGYWQQDVHYKINASIDDKTDIIDGAIELVYTNNSPDELPFVYFHLYSNAQAKGSYLSSLYHNNGMKLNYGKYQEQGLGTNVSKITFNGIDLKTEQDNTVLKVFLPKPIKSGESITFKIDFKTYFDNGTIRNRMKLFNAWGNKHYDVVHWYPRISVYDSKFGWDTDQHMDHEFYGNFGTYDVAFTFPNNYILDATGVLLNKDEVLPADLLAKLDIKNFKNKPWNETPSVIIPADGTKKTWRFHAENVHDFALTADPTYRIGEAEWNGIKCISLAQEPHASRWQNAAEYAAKVIRVNSEDFGMYGYPKMIVADAQDGMEYPMLTLDGGYDPDYRDLLAHEISHNWFFGMVGSNETYRAALDEGFTQFLTNWTYERIDGNQRVKYAPKSKYVERFTEPDYVRNSEVYNGYMNDAARGMETNINVHSDGFGGAIRHGGGYRQVYMKTATMLYNLQYTLGDSLFLSAMQHYFNQWKFAHPYFEDFRNSVIQHTKVDLNWFFDEWIESSKTIDYAVKSVKSGDMDGEYKITFKRKGMQMPIDFAVVAKNDTVYNFHIPNNWFVKKTKATVLPRWIGWDNVKPEYTATVIIPSGIEDVVIDPSTRLADIYMLDNNKKFSIKYRFDSKIYNPPNWMRYEVFARPDIWYNGYDGIKAGLNINGNYMNYKHIFDATVWFNTGIAQNYLTTTIAKDKYDDVNFRISYRTSTDAFMKGSAIYGTAKALDGLNAYTLGFDRKDIEGKNRVYMFFKSMYRKDLNDLTYLLLPNEWTPNQLNNTINMGIEHTYNYSRGTGTINLGLRTSALLSDYDYQTLNLNVINRTRLGKLVLNTRVIGQYGTGNNWASESSLFLAGANPEEMMENKYTRSQGFFDPAWANMGASTNTFQHGGGLNLRGYSGYLAPQLTSDGSTVFTYKGQTGAAVNAELEFDRIVKIRRQNWLTRTFKLTTYLFGDAGIINYNSLTDDVLKMSDVRIDAGLGLALTIKRFGVLQTVNPLTIRFDMPFFLNKTPATDIGFVQYRFVIGVSRAF